MALEPLVAAITGSGLVTAEISAQETRVTSQVSEVLITGGTTRATSQVSEVIITGGTTRITSQVIEVIYPFVEALATTITSTALVTANIQPPSLRVAITGSATVVAGTTESSLLVPFGGITGSATVVALFDKNLEPASSTITFTSVAAAFGNHSGNTLNLTQSATLVNVLSPEPSVLAGLTQTVDHDVVYSRSLESVLGALDHIASVDKVLPAETASSTLSLTDSAVATRLAKNTLNLTQSAVGVIGGIEKSASSTLSCTDQALLDLISLTSPVHTLFLTQNVLADLTSDQSASNTLSCKDHAFAALIEEKCFVILQAPFNFLQTSMVLPCPIWGDTENIVSEVSLRRSMNGATQTHVKTNLNRRLNYTFRILDRQKAAEATEFFKFYNSALIRLTNWKGEVWKVNLLTNPIDFVKTGRFRTDVSLEFEGELIDG